MSSSPTPVSVLIGNLPPAVRAELVCLLRSEPAWRVVPVQPARGQVAATARQHKAELVIADESGMMELAELGQVHPVPVVLYNATPLVGARLRQAVRWNVHDYFGPWVPQTSPAFPDWRLKLLRKLQIAARQRVIRRSLSKPALKSAPAVPVALPSGIVMLGGSTGGSAAVEHIVRELLPTTCTVIVAVHLPAHFTRTLVERLRRITALPVVAGTTGTTLKPGEIVVAPGGGSMTVTAATGTPWISWQTNCTPAAAHSNQPSIDLLMQSVAATVNRPLLGVILSGLGNDGTLGAKAIRQRGGQVIAQHAAAVAAMPQSVVAAGYATKELALPAIAEYINRFATQERPGRCLLPSFSHSNCI